MTLLDINHVDYCYNEGTSPTIHNISLTVCPNSTTVIIGPSGIGKTTLLNLIAGYLKPSQGTFNHERQINNRAILEARRCFSNNGSLSLVKCP